MGKPDPVADDGDGSDEGVGDRCESLRRIAMAGREMLISGSVAVRPIAELAYGLTCEHQERLTNDFDDARHKVALEPLPAAVVGDEVLHAQERVRERIPSSCANDRLQGPESTAGEELCEERALLDERAQAVGRELQDGRLARRELLDDLGGLDCWGRGQDESVRREAVS